ncbi:hypothetical protein [Stenotrophomonas rhizophila]
MSGEPTGTVELIKEQVKAAVLERFNSPFLGAFIVSWLLWNHRVFFVLFADLPVNERFHYIDERLYPTVGSFIALNLVGPLASALAYIFLLPWPTEWVHRWNLQRKLRLWYSEKEAEGSRFLTQEESDELRSQVSELKEKLNISQGDLFGAQRRLKAVSMKGLAGYDERKKKSVHLEYLTSQRFSLDSGVLGNPSVWTFNRDGTIDIKGFAGNVRWQFSDGEVQIYDADGGGSSMGHLTFDQGSNRFEGILSHFGGSRLTGMAHSEDFLR